ncbi:MAG: hypothetical protein ACKOKB_01240, partial [Bacteroidota bacterium]
MSFSFSNRSISASINSWFLSKSLAETPSIEKFISFRNMSFMAFRSMISLRVERLFKTRDASTRSIESRTCSYFILVSSAAMISPDKVFKVEIFK